MAKRVFDLFFSITGLLVLWSIFLIVAIFIVIDDGFPVFFRQQRVGRYGKPFKIWKFRTMKVQNEGPEITVEGDSRITSMGKILRRSKIDELPQLINVLIGEMSFVGPRPEVQKYVNLYTENQKHVLSIRPGITDLASLKYSNENAILATSSNPEKTYIDQIMPDKLKLNLEYLNNKNLFLDFKIIIATVFGKKTK